MIESTHAQEYWLRMAAERAIRATLAVAPVDGDERETRNGLLSRILCWADSRRRRFTLIGLHNDPALLEEAAGHYLRAAVILRREETRQ